MSELKLCPFCACTEKADRVYSFGTDLPGGDGNVALCLRHTSDGYTLHAESIGHNEDGTDYCDNDDDAPINFCPVCGKQLNRRTQPANDPLCEEGENFIQNKFGYCFYSLKFCPTIYNLYVQPQYRRHGYSKVLLGLVIGEIRKSGYKGEIEIQAEPRENSIGLEALTQYYKSMGLIVFKGHPPEGSAEI